MATYDHETIEKKWQEKWEKEGIYTSTENPEKDSCYVLDMFPYPSGEGLHVGHPKGYIASDVYSRHKRMQGFEILHPMGWDAFGLPAENFALEHKVHPRKAVEKNIAYYKRQLSRIGFNYDWSREINTTDPGYYRWTQWIFLKLLKKGLAYQSHAPINWCPSCQTGLANEDLEEGRCERCGSIVEKRPMRQWVLKIREYADRLLEDLKLLPDWPEYIKEMQRHWIGRKEGAAFSFDITMSNENERKKNKDKSKKSVEVFTTRPDTLFGATFLVVSPERAQGWIHEGWKASKEVHTYIHEALSKSEIDRTKEGREKTGIDAGVVAIHPATGEGIPVWVSDYVLGSVGTGAIMAVSAHDERDYEFAQKFGLPIRGVVSGGDIEREAYTGDGILLNSGEFDGLDNKEAGEKIAEKYGTKAVSYRLQDWVFSRQRYWGEPIPIIYCRRCWEKAQSKKNKEQLRENIDYVHIDGETFMVIPVPEEDLPVRLPEVESYEPTGTGESPLAGIEDWVNTTCPKCDGPARRETNTMPQWAGSSWYYLRYMDPGNPEGMVDKEKEKYWAPVDVYVGGAEHATRHLIYARFWHKFLFDIGVVSTPEPFKELHSVGLIEGEDGRKMSKRFGNVINPDDIVENVGADTLRVYEMFMGPFENAIAWSTDGMVGARRFLERVWRLADILSEGDNKRLTPLLHKTIKKVGEDIEGFKFNTAVSAMMIFVNACEDAGSVGRGQFQSFLKLLSPFAPHITEELWEQIGNDFSIHEADWPRYDPALIKEEEVTIAVQVDGKVRDTIQTSPGVSKEDAEVRARESAQVRKYLEEREVQKVIFVPDRIVNFVTRQERKT